MRRFPRRESIRWNAGFAARDGDPKDCAALITPVFTVVARNRITARGRARDQSGIYQLFQSLDISQMPEGFAAVI
jgi:hypothetical protein